LLDPNGRLDSRGSKRPLAFNSLKIKVDFTDLN